VLKIGEYKKAEAKGEAEAEAEGRKGLKRLRAV
jgi:hypothetical protein